VKGLGGLLLGTMAAGILAAATPPVTDVPVRSGVKTDRHPPRRLSTDKSSPHYDDCYVNVRVWLDGKERPNDVHEYDVDEGWIVIRERNGFRKFKIDGRGDFILKKLEGHVEAFFKDSTPAPVASPASTVQHDDAAAQARAEEKRAMRAAKLAKRAAQQ
jgi:hypothetical protein